MSEIWKFQLVNSPVCHNDFPVGAKILSAQAQDESVFIWAECDPSQPKERRVFNLIMTGESFDASGKEYIGTVQLSGGAFVLHVYEVKQ